MRTGLVDEAAAQQPHEEIGAEDQHHADGQAQSVSTALLGTTRS